MSLRLPIPFHRRRQLNMAALAEGRVVWVTGLSGAGKSTLSLALKSALEAEGQAGVVILDGDELRLLFLTEAGGNHLYDRALRLDLAMRYARLCKMLADQGLTVIIATISLFHEVHAWNRENLPGYFEAYLKVPVEELRRRDPKGIYRDFDAGLIKNVAGLDVVVDAPKAPHWTGGWPLRSSAADAADIVKQLQNRGS